MDDKTRNLNNVVLWIENVIDSCTTIQQVYSASVLVNNFYKLYFFKEPRNMISLLKIRTKLMKECVLKATTIYVDTKKEEE